LVQQIRHIRCACSFAVGARLALASAVIGLAFVALCPTPAPAWGERAHGKIAQSALDSLPADCSRKALLYKDDLSKGIIDGMKNQRSGSAGDGSQISADIQLLMLIPHKEQDFSRYFAYRLGLLSVVVADLAFPLAAADSSGYDLKKRLELDIDADVDAYRVFDLTPTTLAYPAIYLERLKADAQKSEGFIRTRYLAGGGYSACKDDILQPSFKNATLAVASLWKCILTKEPEPGALSPPIRAMYYTSQIKFASEHQYLDDIEMALKKLTAENRRIPLTTAFVGNAFFNLPADSQTKRIYELAKSIDPQSASITNCLRSCNEHINDPPEGEGCSTAPKIKVPRYLYGRDGKEPAMYVYQHSSGLLLLTSKVKDVGSDYVLLNFEPIKKYTTKRSVRKIKNEPEVEEYDLEEIIEFYSNDYGVPTALVKAVIKAESNFDPYAVSWCGARGLMQLMPTTAIDMQVTDSFDPTQNIGGGVQYLARMLELFNHDLELALAAYNSGPGNVLKYGGVPPFKETRTYVPRVMTYYEQYKRDLKPVMLKVAMNKKPSADYLPETEVVEEVVVEETLVSAPPVPKSADKVVVTLKNGNTMRGNAYEKTPEGIRLILENGSILIREDLITKIS
jgi:hypothetical protein